MLLTINLVASRQQAASRQKHIRQQAAIKAAGCIYKAQQTASRQYHVAYNKFMLLLFMSGAFFEIKKISYNYT